MPTSPSVLETYQQARQLLGAGDLRGAADLSKRILDSDPDWAYGYHLMSMLFKATGDLDKALTFAGIAVKHAPETAEFYTWIAELYFQKKEFSAAEEMARISLAKKPDDTHALGQLFAALREQKKVTESNAVMAQIVSLQPDDPTTSRLKAILKGTTIENAPKEYVETYFDAYAPLFDHHLQDKLQYKIPALISNELRTRPFVKNNSSFSLLDLGCGTGQVAQALRDITSVRIGVDLSQNMLDQARAKQLYNGLHKADIVEYMRANCERFDLVVAADVLVYIGDVASLFQTALKAVSANGVFVFSIEIEESSSPFKLHATERYTHNPDYIASLAQLTGYRVLSKKECTVRMEKGQPVAGMIFMLTPSETPKIH